MASSDDDWDTDPDFKNDLTEAEKRAYGNRETMEMYQKATGGHGGAVGAQTGALNAPATPAPKMGEVINDAEPVGLAPTPRVEYAAQSPSSTPSGPLPSMMKKESSRRAPFGAAIALTNEGDLLEGEEPALASRRVAGLDGLRRGAFRAEGLHWRRRRRLRSGRDARRRLPDERHHPVRAGAKGGNRAEVAEVSAPHTGQARCPLDAVLDCVGVEESPRWLRERMGATYVSLASPELETLLQRGAIADLAARSLLMLLKAEQEKSKALREQKVMADLKKLVEDATGGAGN